MDNNSKRELLIDNFLISDNSDAFVIAEIGHNHQGNVDLCEKFFQAAANAGATAVKLQKRDNRSLYTKSYYDSPYLGPSSFGETYGAHREFLEFGKKEYTHLQKVAKELNLIFFATAFDFSSADFLLDLNVPVVKIASGDLKSAPLISYLSKQSVPLIMSTGGASIEEITRALDDVDPSKVGLLQCTAAYPAEAEEMDLLAIKQFRKLYSNTVIGLSSHDRGISFPVAAYTLGARIIEKHFTIDRSMKGTDHAFSLEPSGMEKMVRDLKLLKIALGDGHKKVYDKERDPLRKMGKMLVYSRKISAGTKLTSEDFSVKSPCDGLNPQLMDNLLGKQLLVEVLTNQIVQLEHFNL